MFLEHQHNNAWIKSKVHMSSKSSIENFIKDR